MSFTFSETDFKNIQKSNIEKTTKDKLEKFIQRELEKEEKRKENYYIYKADKFTGLNENIDTFLEKNLKYKFVLTGDLNVIVEQSKQNIVFYAFNHTSGRFQHALGVDRFKKFFETINPTDVKSAEICILEFKVGAENTACNNPPELTWYPYQHKNIIKKILIITFWYDPDLLFTEKIYNGDSIKKLKERLENPELLIHPDEKQIKQNPIKVYKNGNLTIEYYK